MDFNHIGIFDKLRERIVWNFLRSPYNRGFAHSLGLKGSEKVLEFGSGSGAVSRHIAALLSCGGSLVCVDTSKGLMDIARRRLGSYPNVKQLEGDLKSHHLKSGSFDMVAVHFVLHDVPGTDRKPLVMELARLLVPGGLLIIREPTRLGHGMPPQEIQSLMRSSGLKEVSSSTGRRMGWVPYFSGNYLKTGKGVRSIRRRRD